MNGLFGIIGLAVAGGILALTVRNYNAAFGMLVALGAGIIIMLSLLDGMGVIIEDFKGIIQIGGLEGRYIEVVIKVIGIAYITQFGADMLRDSGESAIASKCELAGKIFILYLTLPVIGEFLRICIDAVEGIG